MLKEINEEYRTTLINFAKYNLIMFAMAKIMEMTKEELVELQYCLAEKHQKQVCLPLVSKTVLE